MARRKKSESMVESNPDDYKDIFDKYWPSNRRESIPGVCEACGGPYPACKDGCSIFDDDDD